MDESLDRDERLARRVMALEESHTFLSRTLEELSGEVVVLGDALRNLARRVDRLDDRVRGLEGGGDDARDSDGGGSGDTPGWDASEEA